MKVYLRSGELSLLNEGSVNKEGLEKFISQLELKTIDKYFFHQLIEVLLNQNASSYIILETANLIHDFIRDFGINFFITEFSMKFARLSTNIAMLFISSLSIEFVNNEVVEFIVQESKDEGK